MDYIETKICDHVISIDESHQTSISPKKVCSTIRFTESSNDDEHFPSVIELNVGGFTFSTSLQTLRSDEYSMLAAMFREGQMGIVKDSNGAYFIDYDGSCFGDILNFLRNDESFIIPVDGNSREKLKRAAMYFQILDLVKLLDEASFTTKVVNSALSVNAGAKATAIRTLATVGAFGFRFVIFGLIVPLE
mmetsp:Transcript_19722/g.23469  ORF Transcript_19722/g.23469 Transcript_19722/m.23469 type:complete len:190 (+) Transcript_19722:87-656(+)